MNYDKLNKAIDDSGLLRSYIAKQLGMSPKVFAERTHGVSRWKVEEATQLARLLDLSKNDRVNIFLS